MAIHSACMNFNFDYLADGIRVLLKSSKLDRNTDEGKIFIIM